MIRRISLFDLNRDRSGSLLVSIALLLFAGGPLSAISVPQLISYQGKLTTPGGSLVPNDTYSLSFALYDSPSGGTPFWSETQSGIWITSGLFNVLLGAVNPITSLPDGPYCYLEVSVRNEPPLQPRIRLVSSPYSYVSQNADNSDKLDGNHASAFALVGHNHTASGGDVNGTIPGILTIANQAVTTPKIADSAVTMAKIARAGATIGQVIKWNGTTWAPANDSVGSGSGGNPNDYIWNQNASPQAANFWISGTGQAGSSSSYGVLNYNGYYGVYGYSSSYYGVYGYGGDYGVYGRSSLGWGVYGYGGVYGYNSGDYGVYGYGSTGVRGQGTTYGVYGYGSSWGVYGYGGVYGYNSGDYGVYGYGSTGVRGQGSSYGVYGYGSSWGVYGYGGVAGYNSGGYGVYGYGSTGVYGYGSSYGVYSRGNLHVQGNFTASGSKNAVVLTKDYGHRALYCLEAPEVWFEDFGSIEVRNGQAHVELDPIFLQTVTISDRYPMLVYLTPTSPDPVSFTVRKGRTGFDVILGNSSSATFDYRVVAKRAGYEELRLTPSPLEE